MSLGSDRSHWFILPMSLPVVSISICGGCIYSRIGGGLIPVFQRFVLAWALMRYDVFHFFADRGLLDPVTRLQINPEELAALCAAGKRIYIYTYGADVRTRQATSGSRPLEFLRRLYGTTKILRL